MILRAIIENQEDLYHYRIRIPLLNKAQDAAAATPYEGLYVAPVCTLPGMKVNFVKGDVVFVGFEKDQESLPVILGQLYRESPSSSVTDIISDSITCSVDLNVNGDLNLSDKSATPIATICETLIREYTPYHEKEQTSPYYSDGKIIFNDPTTDPVFTEGYLIFDKETKPIFIDGKLIFI